MIDGPSFQKRTQSLLLQHLTKSTRIRQSRHQLKNSQLNHREVAQPRDHIIAPFLEKHHSILMRRAKLLVEPPSIEML